MISVLQDLNFDVVPDLDCTTWGSLLRDVALSHHGPVLAVGNRNDRTTSPLGCQRTLENVPGLKTAASRSRIPGPIDNSPRTFAADPLVHAIFGSASDVCANRCMSRDLREFLLGGKAADGDALYALLGMRRHEKSVMGMALMGEVVRSDVPQTVVYFADHTLTGVSASFEEARSHLREAALDGLLKGFVAELAERREARARIHDEWDTVRTRVRLREAGAEAALDSLTGKLYAADEALAAERLVDDLAAWLATPEQHLRLDRFPERRLRSHRSAP